MRNSPNILVVGSYATGLVMQVERLPLAGETLIGHGFRQGPGGKGSNQAVQAARLGADVSVIACLGNDAFAESAKSLHTRESVDTRHLFIHPELPTGAGFIMVDAHGNNLITVDLGANLALGDAHLQKASAAFEQANVVLAQFEIPPGTALAALHRARKSGARTILNPAPAVDLRSFDLSSVDYLTPNEAEARACLGLDPADPASEEELASMLLDLGVGAIVFTRGVAGARLVARDRDLQQAAFPVEVVDTVGAGDSFNAAFAVGLAEGMSEADALRFGCAAGSLAVTRADTIDSYGHRDQVEAFLTKHPH